MGSIVTFEGIDEALENLQYKNKRTLKYKLINTIREQYKLGSSFDSITAIDTDFLVKILWETGDDPDVIRNRRKNFNSVKSSVNSDLKKLYSEGKNKEGIIINSKNTFDMSEEAKSEILESFSYGGGDGDSQIPLDKITDVLNVINDFISNKESGLEDNDKFEQLKEVIKDISGKVGVTIGSQDAMATGGQPAQNIGDDEPGILKYEEVDSERSGEERVIVPAAGDDLENNIIPERKEDEYFDYIPDEDDAEEFEDEVVDELVEIPEDEFEEIPEDEFDEEQEEELKDDEYEEIKVEEAPVDGLDEVLDEDDAEEFEDEVVDEIVGVQEDEFEEVPEDELEDEEIEDIEVEESSDDEFDEVPDEGEDDASEELKDNVVDELEELPGEDIEDELVEEQDDDEYEDVEVEEIPDDELDEVLDEGEAYDTEVLDDGIDEEPEDGEYEEVVEASDEEPGEVSIEGEDDGTEELKNEVIDELEELPEEDVEEELVDDLEDDDYEEIEVEDIAAGLEGIPDDGEGITGGIEEVPIEDLEAITDEELEEVPEDEIEEELLDEPVDDEYEEIDIKDDSELEEIPGDEEGISGGLEDAPIEDLEAILDEELEEVPEDDIEEELVDELEDDDYEDVEILNDSDEEENSIERTEGITDGEYDYSLEEILDDYDADGYISEEGRQKALLLADRFDKMLSETERYYNRYLLIPGGKYITGINSPGSNEKKKNNILLQDFYFGKFPVTNNLFELFVEKTGYITTAEQTGYGIVYKGRYRNTVDEKSGRKTLEWSSSLESEKVKGACWFQPGGPGSSLHGKRNHPVVQVSLEDAMAFAAWTGKRVPAEDEWEAASRTSRGLEYPWGECLKEDLCNIEASAIGDTTPVDEFEDAFNTFGVYDLLGNVLEWTSTNDSVSGKIYFIAKGGSWVSGENIRLTRRFLLEAKTSSNILGFRCIAYK